MAFKYINPNYLDSISGDDPQMIQELVNMFRQQVSEVYEEMKTLHSQKDFLHLGMLAHKVKSSVAIMGMNELATVLKTFEQSAKEGKDTENYMSHINKFGNDTKAALSELDDLVQERLNKEG